MTSTNFCDSIECCVLRIRKSALIIDVCSNCSIFCSITIWRWLHLILVIRDYKIQTYLSIFHVHDWPFVWCRPSNLPTVVLPLQLIHSFINWYSIDWLIDWLIAKLTVISLWRAQYGWMYLFHLFNIGLHLFNVFTNLLDLLKQCMINGINQMFVCLLDKPLGKILPYSLPSPPFRRQHRRHRLVPFIGNNN